MVLCHKMVGFWDSFQSEKKAEMYNEDDLLPISALQHLMFCPRQCALIHLEQAWSENALTAGGRVLHERVHQADDEFHGEVLVVRSLRLRSLALGLSGIADIVEFRQVGIDDPGGTTLPDSPGRWQPYPVEYKRGRKKKNDCDNVQLCAQAMCLEEMLNCQIHEAALFYGKTRRRTVVSLDDRLRTLTRQTALQLHQMIRSAKTPPPQYSAKCDSCSLIEQCMPKQTSKTNAAAYVRKTLATMLNNHPGKNHEKTR